MSGEDQFVENQYKEWCENNDISKVEDIDQNHLKLMVEKDLAFVSKKAQTSKWWAIALTVLVLYEIIEHVVYPFLVPYLAYMHWFR